MQSRVRAEGHTIIGASAATQKKSLKKIEISFEQFFSCCNHSYLHFYDTTITGDRMTERERHREREREREREKECVCVRVSERV